MAGVRIKICGITNMADAELTARLGADAIGLNFYGGSKRFVEPALAQQIATAMPPWVEPVVLFVNEPLALALPKAKAIAPTIQWHGEDPPLPPPSPWRFIPAFAVVDARSLAKVTAYLDLCRAAGRLPAAILLDGHVPGQYGGTGQTAPWQLLANFNPGVPVFLAGGLTPDNVAEAVHLVRPYAVDVASGVESTCGRKDAEKLERFIDAVRDEE